MSDSSFVDTNVLVYLYSSDEPEKRQRAQRLSRNANSWISTQVLNELCNILRKKFQRRYPEITAVIKEVTRNFHVTTVTADTIRLALTVAEKHGYSYYDSLMIAAALEQNCAVLYSEDMQHGQTLDTMTIMNPFL